MEAGMDEQRLAAEVESPALHRTLLRGFNGPYSLGVGRDEVSAEPVLVLMVPPSVTQAFPARVSVAGESVHVVVQRKFKQPVAFRSAAVKLDDRSGVLEL
jgi:hypothetical protein